MKEVIDLMNDPLVRRHLPLAKNVFDEEAYTDFISAKEQLWQTYGYGPWAFLIEGQFAGWGGLQPEKGKADLAMVLHPNFWGWGGAIYQEIIRRGFGDMGLTQITVLLPSGRKRTKGLLRLGFTQTGVVELGGHLFFRYCLSATESTLV
jgi:RimJ/RimL family protein N-acetyltransferase